VTATPSLPPTPSFVRPVLALLAGLGIMILIVAPATVITTLALLKGVPDARSFQPPAGFLVFTLVLNVIGGFASGFTVARLTHGRSFFTVLLAGVLARRHSSMTMVAA
jgi:hypothetical protein